MSNLLDVTIQDGKYQVIQDSEGRLSAYRHGEAWRDCVGDNLILGLAQRIEELENPDYGHQVDKDILNQKTETELKYLIELVQEVLTEKNI